jgi:hypothetical protein
MADFKPFDDPVKIGECGEPKVGKSHQAASFVKAFDGIFLDFARIVQSGGWSGKTPEYHVARVGHGEAYTACKNAGLDLDRQYKFIKSWDDLEFVLEYARDYRDNISKKKNKRIWLVFDDTKWWRFMRAQQESRLGQHKSISKDDWKTATTSLTLQITELESEFNLLFVNQMSDEWAAGESTGQRQGAWYPSGVEYIYDAVLEYWIDKSKKPYTPIMKVLANRAIWVCSDEFKEDIPNPTPEKILSTIGIDKERW